jgi:hypothetical protein
MRAVTYELLVVHGVDGGLSLVLGGEGDESETTGAPSSGLTVERRERREQEIVMSGYGR